MKITKQRLSRRKKSDRNGSRLWEAVIGMNGFRPLRGNGGKYDRMIGVKRAIIVIAAGPIQFLMINPVLTKKKEAYQAEEGCLSLEGVQPCIRYQETEVDYQGQNFRKQHGKYSGWVAQIIEQEVNHVRGIVV